MEEKTTLVLYPGFGVSHLSPMLELSKLLLRHGGGAAALDVLVVLVQSPFGDPGFDDTVARAKAAHTSVAFHVLPSPQLEPASASDGEQEQEQEQEPQAHDLFTRMCGILRSANAPLRDFLRRSLSSSCSVRCALVLDMFCAHALDVAAELAVPAYFFSTAGASSLAVFLALPGTRGTLVGSGGFRELGDDAVLTFAGVPPIKASDMSQLIRDDGAACRACLSLFSRMPEARGILLNSFESLEPRAVRALRDGLCVPGRSMPKIYCVGPLVSPPSGGGDKDGHGGCLRWMDAQPDRSVVFLSFGSMGAFPKSQLEEIAVGLERSGQRFLWMVRSPREPGGEPADDADVDLEKLLPNGFLERTKSRGLVVKNWAPQVDVLRHRAAGAFVTHCGWNSTLEGVAAGVPLLCWPLYAEQGLNKVFVVEEMRVGVEVRKARVGVGEDEEEAVVKAEEVEAKVRWVMEDSDDGARALRERAAAARDRAAQALADGGPSHVAFLRFLEDLDSGVQRSHG